jgi:D-serine deaminase-like pyridoxal phosphate-dependent protein
VLAAHGITDLLIAYPLWGPSKWDRLCRLAETAEVRVAADSFEVCTGISDAAARRGLVIPVRIEVDTGYRRCGVQSPAEALALAQRIARLPGVRLAGVLSFAGQTYSADPDRIADAAVADAAALVEAAEALRADGFDTAEISIGSTPSATHIAALPGVTEVRPGTYVFSDRDQAALGWGTLDDCALTLLATVVSHPTPTRAIIDAGTKALSSDRGQRVDGCGAIRGRPDWRLVSLNEEHGIMEVPAGAAPIGTQLEIVPNHACGMLNMHDWVAACRHGEVAEWWRVAGRGLIR